MIDAFFDAMETVTVAVSLDEHAAQLARIGARLAARLGKNLCLLHIVEPWSSMPAAVLLGPKSPLWDAALGLDTDLRDRATQALTDLARDIGAPNARILVTTGRPKARLGEEALEAGSCLLVIGIGSQMTRRLPRTFSTVLSLMATTPVPLLVIDPTRHRDFPGETPRLLAADDLSDKGEAAVRIAATLAAKFGQTWLHQVHVNAMTRDVLDAGILAAGNAAHTQVPAAAAAADIHGLLVTQLDRALALRLEPFLPALSAANCRYTREIVDGSTKGELQGATSAMHPDVVVFGRHRSPHEARAGLARIATRAMFDGDAGVLIVPDL